MGAQLRAWREAVGMSAQEAGDALGKSQQTVSGWENDQAVPRIRIAKFIDDVYDLEPGLAAAILGGEAPPAGLVDARAEGLDAHGRVVWSARYLVKDVPAQRRFSAAS